MRQVFIVVMVDGVLQSFGVPERIAFEVLEALIERGLSAEIRNDRPEVLDPSRY